VSAASEFLALHVPGRPLLMPNAWDRGSAVLLQSLGFAATATTSSGFAATLGRLDGEVTREEALAHAADLAAAVDIPVSADLENGFAHDPDGVTETVRGAIAAGVAGCSIEDYTGDDDDPLYPLDVATARVEAAVAAAGSDIVITARAENFVAGRPDLADAIARLQAYEAAGAHVLFAPGLASIDDIRTVVEAVSRPVNVLMWKDTPPVTELAAAGVARVSVGGAFAFAALAAVADAAAELRDHGTSGYLARAAEGSAAAQRAFT